MIVVPSGHSSGEKASTSSDWSEGESSRISLLSLTTCAGCNIGRWGVRIWRGAPCEDGGGGVTGSGMKGTEDSEALWPEQAARHLDRDEAAPSGWF